MTVVWKFVVFGSSRNASAALHSRWIKFQQKFALSCLVRNVNERESTNIILIFHQTQRSTDAFLE